MALALVPYVLVVLGPVLLLRLAVTVFGSALR